MISDFLYLLPIVPLKSHQKVLAYKNTKVNGFQIFNYRFNNKGLLIYANLRFSESFISLNEKIRKL